MLTVRAQAQVTCLFEQRSQHIFLVH
jgi:hypothetical protein